MFGPLVVLYYIVTSHQSRRFRLGAALFLLIVVVAGAIFAPGVVTVSAQSAEAIEFAIQLPLTGDGALFGVPALEGIQLAIEEANAGDGPSFTYTVYDDGTNDERASELAKQIVDSPAVMVFGPAYSTASLTSGPVYAAANMVSLPPSATSDLITQNQTTFRVIFKNSDQGEILATYLARVLGYKRAAVLVVDNAYGNTLREGFERTAKQLKIDASYYMFTNEQEAEQVAQQVARDTSRRPVVMLTLGAEGVRILTTLRRLGVPGPFLGGDTFGDEGFNGLLASEPEEQAQPGFFTDGVYGLAPVILDSGNAAILEFAERYKLRFGKDPVWMAVASYDAATLGIAAARATIGNGAPQQLPAQRAAIRDYLLGLASPERALPGLLGPFWFDQNRARQQAIRIGQFRNGRFESAPIQIVAVNTPDQMEIESGAVFELSPGRYARLQRVVYTGVYLNSIPRIDLPNSSFSADFYIWMRFAREAGEDSADPTNLLFPNMISGSFDRHEPIKQRIMDDGTEYWLWRVQGVFRNEFNLRLFPFDRQDLTLSFFNARADADQMVYVVDQRAVTEAPGSLASTASLAGVPAVSATSLTPGQSLSIASPDAFSNLSQWDAVGASSRRENLVTDSTLGDPAINLLNARLELSGFLVSVDVERRALSTLWKTVLPLLIMTLIMFASLFFPTALVKEKVTVAITAALSGAVLLTSINNQLGAIGYTIMIEYAFYIFFALALLCILAVLSAERLRVAGNAATANRVDLGTRVVYVLAVTVTAIVTALLLLR